MTTSKTFAGLRAHLIDRGDQLALADASGTVSAARLVERIDERSAFLGSLHAGVLATLGENHPDWVVNDLAALSAGLVHVPMPGFFTIAQRQSVLQAAGVDLVGVSAQAYTAHDWAGFSLHHVSEDGWRWLRRPVQGARAHPSTRKITFTSGSTGSPKGVCLSESGMLQVAHSVAQATAPLGLRRHLNALPFAVLLENVAGLYSALMQSTVSVCLAPGQTGLKGASGFDSQLFHDALIEHEIDSVIVLPQMLKAYVQWLEHSGETAPAGLVYMAVGGAPVGVQWLQRAQRVGLPAYEGYGLSEGGSVQTINLPDHSRPGSVGRPLPHTRLEVAPDGELLIAGAVHLGYLTDQAESRTWLPTGDLGRIDSDGYVYLTGRKKNLLITGFGRNVSPEWVETALQDQTGIGVAVVLGDGRPALGAVIWPANPLANDAEIEQAIARANAGLPDYAQVRAWCRAQQPFRPEHGVCTANGRPARAAIDKLYNELLFPADGSPTPANPARSPLNEESTEIK
jgi:long-subunit acyl-CoA synthetase (AMP-forming)